LIYDVGDEKQRLFKAKTRGRELLHAVPRVLDASGLEGIHLIGLHLDMDVDDQHVTLERVMNLSSLGDVV
jgi:hypothetical protein